MKLSILTGLLPAPSLSIQEIEALKDKTFAVVGARSFQYPELTKVDDINAENAVDCQIIFEADNKRVNMSLRTFVSLVVVVGAGKNATEKSMIDVMAELNDVEGEASFPESFTILAPKDLEEKNAKGEMKTVYPPSGYKHYRDLLAKAEKAYGKMTEAEQDATSPYRLVYTLNTGLRRDLLDKKVDEGVEAVKTFKVSI